MYETRKTVAFAQKIYHTLRLRHPQSEGLNSGNVGVTGHVAFTKAMLLCLKLLAALHMFVILYKIS